MFIFDSCSYYKSCKSSCLHNLHKNIRHNLIFIDFVPFGNGFGQFLAETNQFEKCLDFYPQMCKMAAHPP